MNSSKVGDPRSWREWSASGAVATAPAAPGLVSQASATIPALNRAKAACYDHLAVVAFADHASTINGEPIAGMTGAQLWSLAMAEVRLVRKLALTSAELLTKTTLYYRRLVVANERLMREMDCFAHNGVLCISEALAPLEDARASIEIAIGNACRALHALSPMSADNKSAEANDEAILSTKAVLGHGPTPSLEHCIEEIGKRADAPRAKEQMKLLRDINGKLSVDHAAVVACCDAFAAVHGRWKPMADLLLFLQEEPARRA